MPHYITLTNVKEDSYEIFQGDFSKGKKEKKVTLLEEHERLKEIRTFPWKRYYEDKMKLSIRYLGHILYVILPNYKLYQYLEQNIKAKKDILYQQETELDFYHKALCVSKVRR